MIKGVSHMTFVVKDLRKSKKFFEEIFNAKEVYSSDGNRFSISEEKFFLINDIWIAIMQGNETTKSYNHIAFKIDEKDFEIYLNRIKGLGLEIKEGRPRVAGEAMSIYFYDFDNHFFEFHTGDLKSRLDEYSRFKNT